MNRCPIKSCGCRIPRHLLMCRKHWIRVPPDLKEAVMRTYRDGMINQEWIDVREAAVAAVEAVEP